MVSLEKSFCWYSWKYRSVGNLVRISTLLRVFREASRIVPAGGFDEDLRQIQMLFVIFRMVFIRANSECPNVVTLVTGSERWISKWKRVWRVLESRLLWLPAKLVILASGSVLSVFAVDSLAFLIFLQLWLSLFSSLLLTLQKLKVPVVIFWCCQKGFSFPSSYFHRHFFFSPLLVSCHLSLGQLSNSYRLQGLISPLLA